MRRLLGLALALAVAPAPALAADPPSAVVFSGTVMTSGAAAAGFGVTLYRGDGNTGTQFLKDRITIASARTDDAGHFAIVAPSNLTSGSTLTLRAKGFVPAQGDQFQTLGGQVIFQSVTDVNKDITIDAAPVTDPNYGIRNNHYAYKTMYFMTDRAKDGQGFANTSVDFTPSFGTFVGHVALGPASKPSGKCNAATLWQCPPTPKMGDDAYVDKVATTASGSQALSSWVSDIGKKLPSGRRGRILVYVHGYNNDFAGAAATAARLAYQSGQQADIVIAYSWPSANRFSKYTQDLKNVGISIKQNLIPFLRELATLKNQADITVVGHSMGTFALTTAISAIRPSQPDISLLTFFAGDTDVADFTDALPFLGLNASRITVYSNGGDEALHISQCFSGDSRLRIGQTPQNFRAPVRWYDATPVAPRVDFGHGYLTSSFEVAADFNAQMTGVPISAARDSLQALPGFVPIKTTWSINWAPAAAALTCAVLKALP